MRNLNEVAIYAQSHVPKHMRDWLWHTNAVCYLFSIHLQRNKVTTQNIAKVAIFLGDEDLDWVEGLRDPVAMIQQKVDLPAYRLEEVEVFQVTALSAICAALNKLTGPNAVSETVLSKIREDLLKEGFIQYFSANGLMRKRKLQLNKNNSIHLKMRTGATSYCYVLKLTRADASVDLFDLIQARPSWLLASFDFKGFQLINSKKILELKLAHPRNSLIDNTPSLLDVVELGRPYYDASGSSFPCETIVGHDEVTFLFDISSLS